MVMKVLNTSPIMFRGCQPTTKSEEKRVIHPQIKELGQVTPDFAVNAPQKYSKIGETELSNGLKIHSYKLANGHRVTVVPMEGSPTIVKNYVNVGSMNETDNIKGISHFLEHMAFNGTTGENGYIKLNTGDSFSKVEKMGGWTNASTNYALTDYINSTPLLEEKDLEEQIKIIAGMTEDLALTEEMIEKEKGPVCSEINMILDSPQTVLVDQTVRTLFNIKSSADELVAGSTKHIRNLTREDVKAYYDKYYTPDNMNLVITGEVNPQEVIELVSKNFHSSKKRVGKPYEEKMTPINKTIRKDFTSDKATETDTMIAFSGPKSSDLKDKIIFDIVHEYLSSTSFGLYNDLKELNSYGSFGLEKISTNPNNPMMIYYGFDSSEENSEKALKTVFKHLSNAKPISDEQLNTIKERLLQSHISMLEHSFIVNDIIGNDIIDGAPNGIATYETDLNEITKDDVNNFIKKYINLNKAAITVMHPNKVAENNSINFKGARKPLHTENIHQGVLDNNYRVAFLESPTNKTYFNISLKYPIKEDVKHGTRAVLNEMLCMGTMEKSEEDFDLLQENNNLRVSSAASSTSLNIRGSSLNKNFDLTLDNAKELLYSPALTQENFEKAVSRIKDFYTRYDETSVDLYSKYMAEKTPFFSSKDHILESLETITLDDVKEYYQYILENSNGTITMNVPKGSNNLDTYKEKFTDLVDVKPYEFTIPNLFVENNETVVLTKAKPVSQADIMQTFHFESGESINELVSLNLMNTLLSSSSVGLFKVLREKEQLAYSVYSDYNKDGNFGALSCNILTTTDNEENNEISYDNVQKSINGFNRQINAIKNSEYTDEDFESAKRMLKADLLDKEGTSNKLRSIKNSLNSPYGIEFENILFNEIDKITREDITNIANKVFAKPPIYSITASQNTLDANKDFFETL